MDTLGQRISYIRTAMGLTQEQLATALSNRLRQSGSDGRPETITRGAVANWESEGGINPRNMDALVELAEVSYDWLRKGRGEPPGREQLAAIGARLKPAPLMAVGDRVIYPETIPILGAAAGAMTAASGAFMFGDAEPIGVAPMLPGLTGERDVYALFIEESSMVPMYPPKSLVYVSMRRQPRRDDAVIVQEPDSANGRPQAFIKLYVRETARHVVTHQLNPDSNVLFEKRRGLLVHRVYTLRELAGV